jgi:hypothetical protein
MLACSQWQGVRATGRPVLPCPEQTMTPESAAELGREAVVVVDANRHGRPPSLGVLTDRPSHAQPSGFAGRWPRCREPLYAPSICGTEKALDPR